MLIAELIKLDTAQLSSMYQTNYTVIGSLIKLGFKVASYASHNSEQEIIVIRLLDYLYICPLDLHSCKDGGCLNLDLLALLGLLNRVIMIMYTGC